MSATGFIELQIFQIRQGGWPVIIRKIKGVSRFCPKIPLLILAIPVIVVIRLIRPWLVVRWGNLRSSRIGHFAGNTELYLCERDAGINLPKQRSVDFFFMDRLICNCQLVKMWKTRLHIWPNWLRSPVYMANILIPGGAVHLVGNNTQGDRDVHILEDRSSPHLRFTAEEEARGEAELREMGIPNGTPFVCLIGRDSAYLDTHLALDWNYHNYRDSDIKNYVLAAEELADRGYFVIRMGAVVHQPLKSNHPKILDYASNGLRSDFMDIYLGAKCEFCVSGLTGFDAVPLIFRRPIAFVNFVPLGYLCTFGSRISGITKHHFSLRKQRELTFKEIFTSGVGFYAKAAEYESAGIQLVENSPEEIRDAAVEMAERLNGTWQPQEDDQTLQRQFWEIFPNDAKTLDGKPLHGVIQSRFGSAFLQNNRALLD